MQLISQDLPYLAIKISQWFLRQNVLDIPKAQRVYLWCTHKMEIIVTIKWS